MPKVGSGSKAKHFPYTEKGEKQANAYGKKTGQKVTNTKPKKRG